MKSNFNQNF